MRAFILTPQDPPISPGSPPTPRDLAHPYILWSQEPVPRTVNQEEPNYCSLREIREEAGALNAYTLPDTTVAQCRSNAQNEINASLRNVYGKNVPFNPVPGAVKTLTIQLAAALLRKIRFPGQKSLWEDDLDAARESLEALQNKDSSLTDDEGEEIIDSSIGFYPGDNDYRAFRMDMEI